jgi:hypothetical protein
MVNCKLNFVSLLKLVIMKSNVNLLFYLKKQKNYKNDPIAIYLRIMVGGTCTEHSTGRECDPAKWNSTADRAASDSKPADAPPSSVALNPVNNYLTGSVSIYCHTYLNCGNKVELCGLLVSTSVTRM